VLRIVVILLLVFIVGSLLSAGYFLVKDQGGSDRTLRALTVRIILSVCVFALMMVANYFGWLGPRWP
jgi:hypothetical protein